MLLEELTLAPPKAIGATIGKMYAELAHIYHAEVKKRDAGVFSSTTANFDTQQFHLLFFFTYHAKPPRPPAMKSVTTTLMKKYKLPQFEVESYTQQEDEHSWSINLTIDLADFMEENHDRDPDIFDNMSDAAVAAFKANIGELDHQINS